MRRENGKASSALLVRGRSLSLAGKTILGASKPANLAWRRLIAGAEVEAEAPYKTKGGSITISVGGLKPRTGYPLFLDGKRVRTLVADPSGDVFVVGVFSKNVLQIEAPSLCGTAVTLCTIREIIDHTGDGSGTIVATDICGADDVTNNNPLCNPVTLAVDPSGDLYVTGFLSHNVFQIAAPGTCSTDGTPCTIVEILDATGDGAGNLLDGAFGVAVEPDGTVYVTGNTSNNAFQITPGGTVAEIADGDTEDGDGNDINGFRCITVDPANGNVYVAGVVTDNVFRIIL